jgi:hypothetical protein
LRAVDAACSRFRTDSELWRVNQGEVVTVAGWSPRPGRGPGDRAAIRLSRRAGGGAWLVVADDGPGFPDADLTERGRHRRTHNGSE